MPSYSEDAEAYRNRVHANGRTEDPEFSPDELLYRRVRESDLVDGVPSAASLPFGETAESGHSVNRQKYSAPQDVLEPDCCDGVERPDCVVVQFEVREVPEVLRTDDGTGRVYRFTMKHVPRRHCYAHSEIWCNQRGDIAADYERPPREIRNQFRGELARAIQKRGVLRFTSIS